RPASHNLILRHAWPGSFGYLTEPLLGWSIVMSTDYRLDVLFVSHKISLITDACVLVDSVQVGGFSMSWEGHNFVVYTVTYPLDFGVSTTKYVLHDGAVFSSYKMCKFDRFCSRSQLTKY
ncbi:hypothetical protein C8J56DRAFT_917964, partial [Mycena floridula]